MKFCTNYLNITFNLLKKLINDVEIDLLDIIFSHFKLYDNDFILKLLFHYKNKIDISSSDLAQQISNEKFKILVNSKNKTISTSILVNSKDNPFNNIHKYLINECQKKKKKKNINISIIKFLFENGVKKKNDSLSLYFACENGNLPIMKYLVEHGADFYDDTFY